MKSSTLDEQIALLACAAIAEMQAIQPQEADQHDLTSEELTREREEDERYFQHVAIPLGEHALRTGIMGSDLISEDRGE